MKTFVIFTLLTLSLAAASPVSRIVDGEEAKVGQFPYQVLVQPEFDQGKALCGGILLNERFVLTAAHCLVKAKGVDVHLGAHDRTDVNEQGRVVLHSTVFKAHEKFNVIAHNDVGMIKLPQSVNFTEHIKPVKLPKNNKDKYEDEVAVVSGWGVEHTGSNQPPQKLRFTELTVISNAECKKVYNQLIVKDTTLCAKGETKESACNGDSGGPLVLKKTGELVGVVSFVGSEGCEVGLPVGFARVNKFLDWIKKQQNEL